MNPHKPRTSTDIQEEFNQVCFKLGQEIGNERRAQENQETLKQRQKDLEQAFFNAQQKEAKKAMAEKDTSTEAPAPAMDDAAIA